MQEHAKQQLHRYLHYVGLLQAESVNCLQSHYRYRCCEIAASAAAAVVFASSSHLLTITNWHPPSQWKHWATQLKTTFTETFLDHP